MQRLRCTRPCRNVHSVLTRPSALRCPPTQVRKGWLDLVRLDLGFHLPLIGLIYGLVPRHQRVLAEEVANLVYATLLSLWRQEQDELADVGAHGSRRSS